VKELIIEHKFRHLHLRVFKGMEDDYDLVFTSCDYPYFRVQFKNLDKINLDHLYPLYRNRAWILQWLPPRWCHYLVIGA
jgi:hypothetical protein